MSSKRTYFARVKDRSGKLHKGHWFRVTDIHGTQLKRSTRAWALLDLAKAKRSNKNLMGYVDSEELAADIVIDDWLTGDVVPIARVPKHLRAFYRDTLERTARAVRESGEGPQHVNDSFRTDAEQQERIDVMNAGGPIAAPLGKSPHQRGIGLDIPNVRDKPKLIAALRAEQMIDDVPSEKWHITNHAALALGA